VRLRTYRQVPSTGTNSHGSPPASLRGGFAGLLGSVGPGLLAAQCTPFHSTTELRLSTSISSRFVLGVSNPGPEDKWRRRGEHGGLAGQPLNLTSGRHLGRLGQCSRGEAQTKNGEPLWRFSRGFQESRTWTTRGTHRVIYRPRQAETSSTTREPSQTPCRQLYPSLLPFHAIAV
jgi:hypothetical protein